MANATNIPPKSQLKLSAGTLAGDRGRKLDKYVGVAEGSWSLLLLVVRVIPDPLTFVSAPGSGQCQTLPNSDPKLAPDSGLMFDN